MLRHFDHGTQRAILKLYRSPRPEVPLEAIAAPALVVWGERDRYVDASWAPRVAEALGGGATVRLVPGAGHWPWHERPEVVDDVARFLVAED